MYHHCRGRAAGAFAAIGGKRIHRVSISSKCFVWKNFEPVVIIIVFHRMRRGRQSFLRMKCVLNSTLTKEKTDTASWKSGKLLGIFLGCS